MSLARLDFATTLAALPWAPCGIDLAPARWAQVRGRIYDVAHADHRQRLASVAHEHTIDLPFADPGHGCSVATRGLRACLYMGRLGVRGARPQERPVVMFMWLMRPAAVGPGWADWPWSEPRREIDRVLLSISEQRCEYHAHSLLVQGPVLSCHFKPALAGGAS